MTRYFGHFGECNPGEFARQAGLSSVWVHWTDAGGRRDAAYGRVLPQGEHIARHQAESGSRDVWIAFGPEPRSGWPGNQVS